MKPCPDRKKQRSRPKLRSRNGIRRLKSIQVKLSDEEFAMVHRKFGRAAAAIAREHWLGFETKEASAPNAEHVLQMVRALYSCQVDIELLSRDPKSRESKGSNVESVMHLNKNFQHLLRVWYSSFSAAKK